MNVSDSSTTEITNDTITGVYDPSTTAHDPSFSMFSSLPYRVSDENLNDKKSAVVTYPNWGPYVSPSEQESAWICFSNIYRTLNPGYPSSMNHSFLISLRLRKPTYEYFPSLAYEICDLKYYLPRSTLCPNVFSKRSNLKENDKIEKILS